MTHLIRAIDAHVGGQSLRLLTDGVPRPPGRTIAQQGAWLARHADHVRRTVVLEPRGHRDLLAALLVGAAPGLHAGIVFMGAGGYPPLSGHGVMAIATMAVERALLVPRADAVGEIRLAFETAAGTVYARCRVEDRGGSPRVDSVAFTGVPAFVQAAGHAIRVGGRDLRVDIAFGGVFYAIVDTEAVGIPLVAERVPDLRRMAADIMRAVAATPPAGSSAPGSGVTVGGVIFTGPPHDPESHLRTVTVRDGGAVNRSPGGTGMSAVMSVLDAMGLLPQDRPFVQEGLVGSLFRGRVIARSMAGALPAVSTEIEGSAWITGEHTFLVDEDDPLYGGFVI